MLHNNIGILLVKLHENTEDKKPQEEQKGDGMFSFAKNKRANTEKDKAMAKAKEHFNSAIALDDTYVKPLYHRMMLLKSETEYEEALADAKKISELEPSFRGIGQTVIELEKL